MNISEIIVNRKNELTKTEKRVAELFRNEREIFAFSTLDGASEAAGTSTTSIIRFCRKLGFQSFKEFQNSLREEIKSQLSASLTDRLEAAVAREQSDTVLKQVLEHGIGNIRRTFEELPQAVLDTAVSWLSSAEHVFTFGLRESASLANYSYTQLQTMRRGVRMLSAADAMAEQILDITENDVCLCFMFHRYTVQSISLVPLLRAQGAKVILVTSYPTAQVREYADLLIPCYTEAVGIKNSQLAPLCLVDYLSNSLAVYDPARTADRFQRIDTFLKEANVITER